MTDIKRFIGPDNPLTDGPDKSAVPASKRFIGPDQVFTESTNNPPSEKPFVGPDQEVKSPFMEALSASAEKLTSPVKPLLFPLKSQTEEITGPVTPPEHPLEKPAPGEPGLLDVSLTDLAQAYGGAQGLSLEANIAKEGWKALGATEVGLKDFISKAPEIGKLPPQPELPSTEVVPTTPPQMGIQRLLAAKREPTGEVTIGHTSGEVATKQLAIRKAADEAKLKEFNAFTASAKPGDKFDLGAGNEVEFIGVQKGSPAHGIEDQPLFNLKGENLPENHPEKSTVSHTTIVNEGMLKAPTTPEEKLLVKTEIAKKGFVNAQGNFIGPDQAVSEISGQGTEAGPAFARELPFASSNPTSKPNLPISEPVNPISFSRGDILDINQAAKTNLPVPPEQTPLFSEPIAEGKPTEPFKFLKQQHNKLLEDSSGRIAKIKTTEIKDIDPKNPLTSRAELDRETDKLADTMASQSQAGERQGNIATEEALKIKAAFRKANPTIKEGSTEAEAVFHYMDNPNKAAMYQELVDNVGKEKADEIKKAAEHMKNDLDQMLPLINKVRALNGKPPIAYRNDYIPHMNRFSILEQLGLTEMAGTPEGDKLADEVAQSAAKLIRDSKMKHLDSVIFAHVARKGGDTATDAIQAYDRYLNSATRYIHLQPYVNELNASSNALQKTAPNLATYLRNQADALAGKGNPLDNAIKSEIPDTTYKRGLQMISNILKNLVQGSVSVLGKQLYGVIPTVMEYPVRDQVSALYKLVTDPEMRAFAQINSPILKQRALMVAKNELQPGMIGKQLDKLLYQLDYEVSNFAFLSAFQNSIREGKPMAQAIQEATQHTIVTQGSNFAGNTPSLMRSSTLKGIAFPFQNRALAYSRYMFRNFWQDKTVSEKTLGLLKGFLAASAIGGVTSVGSRKAEFPLEPKNVIPLIKSLSSFGGPAIESVGSVVESKDPKAFFKNLIKLGFLVQGVIPAGGLVGKTVADSLFGTRR